MGWIFLASGIFALTSASLNWDWLKSQGRTQFLIERFGEAGARAIYFAVGTFLFVLAVWTLFFSTAP